MLGHLHAQLATGAGARGAGQPSVKPGEGHGAAAAREPHLLAHLGDGADAGELALVLGNEQNSVLVAGLDGEGHVHVGEDDRVFQRYQAKSVQSTVSIAAYAT